MAKTAEAKLEQDVAKDLLSSVPTDLADMQRCEGGYQVRVIYLPDLTKPDSAHVSVCDGKGNAVESITVSVENAFKAFIHPAVFFSKKVAQFINTGKMEGDDG